MSPDQVIANYEALLALTERMRVAAEHGEWEQLISIEQQCSELVEAMKPVDDEVKLDEATRERKCQLINQILADNAEICHHTQTWMSELQRIMQSNRQEQRLQHAYGE
jgi:flagellar protein FliT